MGVASRRRRGSRFLHRPWLEVLEDRVVLSAIAWTNPDGGDWDTASNWSSDAVPTAGDDVTISIAVTNPITHGASSSDFAQSLTSQDPIEISGGSLSIAAASTINNTFMITGGELTGAGDVTITGSTTWSGGTMSGTGATAAQGGLQLGDADSSSHYEYLYGRTLTNAGAVTWMGNNHLYQYDGSTFDNRAGATFDFQSAGNWYSDGTSTLDNAGTLEVDAGAATTSLAPFLVNTGSVMVDAGTLALSDGGDATGSFTVAIGAVLAFEGPDANPIFGDGSSVGGDGTVAFNSPYSALWAVFEPGSSYDVTGATVIGSGASVRFLAASQVSAVGDLIVGGGVLDFSTGAAVSASSLTESSGILSGSDTVIVTGPTIWTGGVMSGAGTTIAQGGLQLGAADGTSHVEYLEARYLDNSGTAAWLGSNSFFQYDGSTFDNLAGASFDFESGGYWDNGDGDAQLINQGTIESDTASANLTIYPFLNNSGAIEVDSGTLTLQGSGTATGSFSVAAGATLVLGGPYTFTFNPGSSVTGSGNVVYDYGSNIAFTVIDSDVSGTVTIASGIVDFEGNVTIGELDLTGGILTGSGTVKVTGLTTWTGGSMSGTGTTIAQGGLQLGADDGYTYYEYLDGRNLQNAGIATWVGSNALYQYEGSTFANEAGGTLEFQGDGAWYSGDGTGRLVNAGTVETTAGTATSIGVILDNSGTIAAGSGTLDLTGGGYETGAFTVTAGATLQLGGGALVFESGSSVSGPGTVDVTGPSTAPTSVSFLPGSIDDVTGQPR